MTERDGSALNCIFVNDVQPEISEQRYRLLASDSPSDLWWWPLALVQHWWPQHHPHRFQRRPDRRHQQSGGAHGLSRAI